MKNSRETYSLAHCADMIESALHRANHCISAASQLNIQWIFIHTVQNWSMVSTTLFHLLCRHVFENVHFSIKLVKKERFSNKYVEINDILRPINPLLQEHRSNMSSLQLLRQPGGNNKSLIRIIF